MKKLIALACVCFLTAGFMGCASLLQGKKDINPAMLEPQIGLKFNDVPVPMGFKILPKESYIFSTEGVRVGMLKYRGKANADYVISFFKEQMAMYNWNLLNVVEFNERIMNFDRDSETCIINLLSKGSTVFITISVGPKSAQARAKQREALR